MSSVSARDNLHIECGFIKPSSCPEQQRFQHDLIRERVQTLPRTLLSINPSQLILFKTN